MSVLLGVGQVTGDEVVLDRCKHFSGLDLQRLLATNKYALQLVQPLLAHETSGYPQKQLLILDRMCNVNGRLLALMNTLLWPDKLARTKVQDAV